MKNITAIDNIINGGFVIFLSFQNRRQEYITWERGENLMGDLATSNKSRNKKRDQTGVIE